MKENELKIIKIGISGRLEPESDRDFTTSVFNESLSLELVLEKT